ncbi:uncharacterized protein LOC108032960 [Drosophila biarmipes]|uniref:uncharacterized protein LOC108032960 n=1 Tax=Drosophila biarmipes TaxID=125945 RepID=UPI0007E73277|nr:uncharacterized protein LOC108032960 [Drosophila biarmipes]
MAYKQNRQTRTKPNGGLYKLLQLPEIFQSHEMEHWIGGIIGMLCILQLLQGSRSTTYEVIGDEKTMDIICDAEEDKGNIPIRQVLDVSGLTFEVADDLETLYYNGDIKVLMDVPSGSIGMEVDVFRWERSQWLPTPLALKRDSLCNTLTNPRELWYPLFKNIPKEELICPPGKGHVYTLSNVSNHEFVRNMPLADIAGDLKAVVHLSSGDLKTCVVFFFKVYIN